jgi:hypothetical protein
MKHAMICFTVIYVQKPIELSGREFYMERDGTGQY